jgi:DnaJ-class molecular chaperone
LVALNPGDALTHPVRRAARHILETDMDNLKGPNIKKRPKCKNCKGEGQVKKGDKVVKCQRCKGTGLR